MVVEIFCQPILGSPACVAEHRILLPDLESSSNHPHDPGQYSLFKLLDVGLRVQSDAIWKDEWRHITIARDHLKHHDLVWVFGFHQYEYEFVHRLTSKHSEIFVFDLDM